MSVHVNWTDVGKVEVATVLIFEVIEQSPLIAALRNFYFCKRLQSLGF